jgi:hypothetical protein
MTKKERIFMKNPKENKIKKSKQKTIKKNGGDEMTKTNSNKNNNKLFPKSNKIFFCIKTDQWLKIDSKQALQILNDSPFLNDELNRIRELCHEGWNDKFLDKFEIYAMHVDEKNCPEAIKVYPDYENYE